ncbi:MAG: putative lipid II flippase FtsW [Candidatus Omnitrophica bacterium]|nr:putative lipid II flippase FtsW [Candidatus Omnitrophota bacterium]
MRTLRRKFLLVAALLVVTGIVMVYSTTAIYAQEQYKDAAYFLKRHLFYLAVGLLLSGWVLSLDPQRIRRWTKPFVGVTLLLLAAVMVPGMGHRVSGASRWFRLGAFSVQPSEFAQLAIILYLADVLSRKRRVLENFFQGVLPPLVVLGVTLLLIVVEPDLGTAVALGVVALLLFFIAGVRRRVLVSLLLLAVPLVVGLVILKPYRVHRVMAYLNPWADPEGIGFQLIQSLVALGSGGVMGVGLGESRQKLFYLPAAHTDFIFSVIGEELGLVGGTVVLILLGFLFWYGIRLALQSPDAFGAFAGLGVIFLLALETLVHVGVTTGAIPTKGLPLPFISYGGTALVVNLMSVAVLLNLARPRQVVVLTHGGAG